MLVLRTIALGPLRGVQLGPQAFDKNGYGRLGGGPYAANGPCRGPVDVVVRLLSSGQHPPERANCLRGRRPELPEGVRRVPPDRRILVLEFARPTRNVLSAVRRILLCKSSANADGPSEEDRDRRSRLYEIGTKVLRKDEHGVIMAARFAPAPVDTLPGPPARENGGGLCGGLP